LTHTNHAGRGLGAGVGLAIILALIAIPSTALGAGSGGIGSEPEQATVAGAKAKLVDGVAVPPAGAPPKVVRAINAANRIVKGRPYCWGGGHARWQSSCYDCSGSVSYALGKPGARVLDAPMPSGSFMRWEKGGEGRWITTYANGGHIYAVIAGLRLDTSMTVGDGPGWSEQMRDPSGFRIRHPARF
jgi:hypothetical protein